MRISPENLEIFKEAYGEPALIFLDVKINIEIDEDGKKEIFVSIGNGSSELETLIYYFVLESNRMF